MTQRPVGKWETVSERRAYESAIRLRDIKIYFIDRLIKKFYLPFLRRARVVCEADAIPVRRASIKILWAKGFAWFKATGKSGRTDLRDGKGVLRIFQVFNFMKGKNILANGII